MTGCSRSGTAYTSRLLQSFGFRCGHERIFNIHTVVGWRDLDVGTLFPRESACDSSFLAAPLLDRLTSRHIVFHQLRNPIEVLRSHMGMRFFGEPSEPSCWLAENHDEFIRYVLEHAPSIAAQSDELRRTIDYWVAWNGLVEQRAQISSATYFRYRVEDLTAPLVLEMLRLVGADRPDLEEIERSLSEISTQANRRVRDETIDWDSVPSDRLGDAFRDAALRYGYLLK